MATPVALSVLRTRVRKLADARDSSFMTDDEVNESINTALRQLYSLLRQHRGQEYYASAATFPTVAGKSTYNLPVNFLELISLIAQVGTVVGQLPTWEPSELPMLLSREAAGGTSAPWDLRYRLGAGDTVELRPAPSGVVTILVRYVPTLAPLVADVDTCDVVAGWEEWACLTAAIEILESEESDAAPRHAARQAIEQQIAVLCSRRADQPSRVQEIRRDRSAYVYAMRGRGGLWEG